MFLDTRRFLVAKCLEVAHLWDPGGNPDPSPLECAAPEVFFTRDRMLDFVTRRTNRSDQPRGLRVTETRFQGASL